MELSVLKIDGSESGKKVVLDEKVFGIEPTEDTALQHKMTLFFWLNNGKVFIPLDMTDNFLAAARKDKRLSIEITDLDINLKDLIGTRNAFEITVEEWNDVFININM